MLFFDIETRSDVDLPKHGLMRYASSPLTEVIVLCFIHDEKEYTWVPEHRRGPLHDYTDFDAALRVWNERINAGDFVVAWNAQFDRTILEHTRSPLAKPKLEQTLDAMAQAQNFSLPGGLDNAAKILGLEQRKQTNGKKLIELLCWHDKPWQPTREQLTDFWEYCIQDVRVLKEVWNRCRPWVASEWGDYHVVERMNARGVPIDKEFAERAAELGDHNHADLNKELRELTGDSHISLRAHKRKGEWLARMLEGSELQKIIKTNTGWTTCATALAELCAAADILEPPDTWGDIMRFMEIVKEGGGVAADKYKKIHEIHYKSRIYHQYRCSPTITGRHASRGVQLDNVLRETLDSAHEVIEGTKERWSEPSNYQLARLIRPTIMAPKGEELTWGDWSSIEARVLPWLANTEEAEKYLDVFRQGDDVYKRAAAGIYSVPLDEITKEQRFIGKIAVLSLGYQGGAGALMRMARSYGTPMDSKTAEAIKQNFRNTNPWLVDFWQELMGAMDQAARNPGKTYMAGRVFYIRHGQNLYCRLPCGRVIVYPELKWQRRWHKLWEKYISGWSYRKSLGMNCMRSQLYPGILTENITQGTAASLLRDLMRRLDAQGFKLLASRHDEVLVEGRCVENLREAMLVVPEWASGLPLEADVAKGKRYGK